MNRCISCGKKIQEGYTLCSECARKLHDDEICEDAISLTQEAYSDLCLRAAKADDLQRALDFEKGAYNALVKNIQCDDAISRKDVINAIDKWISEYKPQHYLIQSIRELPSVTQKSGKWINKDFRKEEYVLTGKCSVCGQVRVIDKYCPNCGCRMVEPQESEE